MQVQKTVISLPTLGLVLLLLGKISLPGFSTFLFLSQVSSTKRHFYFSGGFKKGISEKLTINPNFLIKKVSNAPSSLDFSTMLFYEDSFWFWNQLWVNK